MAAGLIVRGALTAAFLAASFFLRPKTNTVRGANPNIPIQQSEYGVMQALLLGKARTGGNIVWASELRREEETESAGGKGLGGSTVTTYTYNLDFAVMLTRTRVEEIIRIWADGKLIYDVTGTSPEIETPDLVFRLLKGEEDQEPDSLIQTDVDGRLGVGSTPAYRGRSVVVFERFQLKNFGTRIPNLTFEVIGERSPTGGEEFAPVVTQGALFSSKSTVQDTTHIDWDRKIILMGGAGGVGGDPNNTGVGSIVTLEYQRTVGIRMADGGSTSYPKNGNIVTKRDPSGNVARMNHITGATIISRGNGLGTWEGAIGHAYNAAQTMYDGESAVYVGIDRTTVGLNPFRFTVCDGQMEIVTQVSRPSSNYSMIDPTSSSNGTAYCGFASSADDEIRLYGLGFSSPVGSVNALSGFDWDAMTLDWVGSGTTIRFGLLATLTPATFSGASITSNSVRLVHDQSTNDVIIFCQVDSQNIAVRYVPGTGVIWQTNIPFLPGNPGAAKSRVTSREFAWMDNGGRLCLIDITSGQLSDIYDGNTVYSALDGSFAEAEAIWDEESRAFYLTPDTASTAQTRVRKISLGLGAAADGGITLADVVSVISEAAGLEVTEDYDVSELTPFTVPGYLIAEQQSARDSIQPLSDIYFFDGIESDYKLRYRTRGRTSSASLTEDDMIPRERSRAFNRTRVQEAELPRTVQIISTDRDSDYQPGTQEASRNGFPDPSNRSNNLDTVNAPIVLEQSFARQAAEKRLYTAWSERDGFEFRATWEFIALDPSDVLNITFDDGLVTDARLEASNIGANYSLEFKGVGQGAGQYISTIAGESGNNLQVTVPAIVNSQLFLLDVPLLQDTDAPTSGIARMYWAGNTLTGETWTGGTLFESENLVDYEVRDALATGAAYGILTADVNPPESFWRWDDVNTIALVVQAGDDQFVSSTDLSVLNGANALAIIRDNAEREVELIHFVNASFDAGTNLLTLSRLLRGRRGTEVFGGTAHVSGQTAVLLQSNKVSSFLDQSSEAGSPHLYRLISVGQGFDDGSDLAYTPTLRSLRPYAPVNLTATTNASDIDLAATRRTRFNGELQDGTGEVPLNEDSEAYELEILNGAGDTVLRTVTGLSTPFYKYLSSDITTDFGSAPATLNLRWYQISAAVGRGFTTLTNVEVE